MTPAEAAAVLATAAAYDNRTISEIAARAWAEALPDIAAQDARTVVVQHYRGESRWIMPADIAAGVKRLVRERVRDLEIPAPPESIHPDDTATERAWVRAYVAAVGAGNSQGDADVIACAAVDVIRPAIEPTRPPSAITAAVAQVAATTRLPRAALTAHTTTGDES